MCGIVAYCGPERRSLSHELVRRLATLEYRGYDSAGVLSIANAGMSVVKSVGSVSVLAERLRPMKVSEARVGMAHTRWATHGAVTETNAHPIVSLDGRLAIALNGVVENDFALRKAVAMTGRRAATDCDAATLLAVIEIELARLGDGDIAAACKAALAEVEGRVAFCVVHRDQPERLVIARRGSPLFVGRAGKSLWIASDPVAFPETVDAAYEVVDGQTVTFAGGQISADAELRLRAMSHSRKGSMPERGPYATFFEKEILEQDVTVARAVEAALQLDSSPFLGGRAWSRVVFLGCGSAFHACLTAKLAFERWARISCEVALASEFLSAEPVIGRDTLIIAVSQSGETADTLAAAGLAVGMGGSLIAVTNARGSALDRLASWSVDLGVGQEVSVASTKAYTAMIVRLTLLAAELGVRLKTLSAADFRVIAAEARELGGVVNAAFGTRQMVCAAGDLWRDKQAFMFMGRGLDQAAALEGALKLRELSYRHADGIAAGELKHGSLALVEAGYPVIAIGMDRRARGKTMTAMREVHARGAAILAVVGDDDLEAKEIAQDVVKVPAVHDVWGPLVAAVPLQWLALHVAQELGRCIDRPRNLAKSVTVV